MSDRQINCTLKNLEDSKQLGLPVSLQNEIYLENFSKNNLATTIRSRLKLYKYKADVENTPSSRGVYLITTVRQVILLVYEEKEEFYLVPNIDTWLKFIINHKGYHNINTKGWCGSMQSCSQRFPLYKFHAGVESFPPVPKCTCENADFCSDRFRRWNDSSLLHRAAWEVGKQTNHEDQINSHVVKALRDEETLQPLNYQHCVDLTLRLKLGRYTALCVVCREKESREEYFTDVGCQCFPTLDAHYLMKLQTKFNLQRISRVEQRNLECEIQALESHGYFRRFEVPPSPYLIHLCSFHPYCGISRPYKCDGKIIQIEISCLNQWSDLNDNDYKPASRSIGTQT